MSKELPFFKFHPSEWLLGRISFQPHNVQGAFTQCCCVYWQKNCKMTIADIDFRIGQKMVQKLIDLGFLKAEGEYLHITFLDEQLTELDQIKEKKKLAGSIGGQAKAKQSLARAKQNVPDKIKNKIKIKIKNKEEDIDNNSSSAVADEKTVYQKFISVYDQFVLKKTDGPAKIDGEQGKAANSIIAYLRRRPRIVDDDTLIQAWIFILDNWDKLDEYQSRKIKLSEISSDITKIFDQISSYHKRQNGQKKEEKLVYTAPKNVANGAQY